MKRTSFHMLLEQEIVALFTSQCRLERQYRYLIVGLIVLSLFVVASSGETLSPMLLGLPILSGVLLSIWAFSEKHFCEAEDRAISLLLDLDSFDSYNKTEQSSQSSMDISVASYLNTRARNRHVATKVERMAYWFILGTELYVFTTLIEWL